MVDAAPPLLVFADDWGRHPSSCQHLMHRLLPRYPIYWVNTIGTRTPSLNWATAQRGLEKVRHWLHRSRAPVAAADDNPRVLNPRMWPWFGSRFSRWLNRRLLTRQLSAALQALPEQAIAITTLPIVSDLIGVLPVRRWVYYCVDDFSLWPGLDQVTLARMEERLIERADVVIAVSETLQEKLARKGRETRLLTHGVDLECWTAGQNGAPPVPGLAELPRPLIVFWGVIDRRMDVAMVRRLADDLTEGTIVLVGPEQDPDPELFASPRVVRLPALPFHQLPALAQQAAVLIMPYADLPITRAIQPLKLKEYLATGKPTVVRDLPAVRSWAACLDMADTPEAFSRAVRVRLAEGLPEMQRQARERLVTESWSAKAHDFEQWALYPELR